MHEQLGDFLFDATRELIKEYNEGWKKFTMMVFFIVTCVCFIFDITAFFFGIAWMSNNYTAFSYAGCLILCVSSVMVTLDLYYVIWICSMFFKFPLDVAQELIQALIGFPTKLNARFDIVIEVPKKAGSKSTKGKKGKEQDDDAVDDPDTAAKPAAGAKPSSKPKK